MSCSLRLCHARDHNCAGAHTRRNSLSTSSPFLQTFPNRPIMSQPNVDERRAMFALAAQRRADGVAISSPPAAQLPTRWPQAVQPSTAAAAAPDAKAAGQSDLEMATSVPAVIDLLDETDDSDEEVQVVSVSSGRTSIDLTMGDSPSAEPTRPSAPPATAQRSQVPVHSEDDDAAFARRLASLCERCEEEPATPGFSWCSSCYHESAFRRGGSFRGGGNVRDGGGLRGLGAPRCTMCCDSAANPGYDWCTRCYLAQRGRGSAGRAGSGGGGSFGGGVASAPPENATYEQLLAWEEARGAAGPPKGLTGQQLSSLPQRVFLGARDALQGEDALCIICQCKYEQGDALDIMPACAHIFHHDCVGMWLKDQSTCPVCMRNVKEDLQRSLGRRV